MLDELKALCKKFFIQSFSGPYFPAFGLNMEVYSVSGIQLKSG